MHAGLLPLRLLQVARISIHAGLLPLRLLQVARISIHAGLLPLRLLQVARISMHAGLRAKHRQAASPNLAALLAAKFCNTTVRAISIKIPLEPVSASRAGQSGKSAQSARTPSCGWRQWP
jgi:hypothetical protein